MANQVRLRENRGKRLQMQNLRSDKEAREESLSQTLPGASRMSSLPENLHEKGQPELPSEEGSLSEGEDSPGPVPEAEAPHQEVRGLPQLEMLNPRRLFADQVLRRGNEPSEQSQFSSAKSAVSRLRSDGPFLEAEFRPNSAPLRPHLRHPSFSLQLLPKLSLTASKIRILSRQSHKRIRQSTCAYIGFGYWG